MTDFNDFVVAATAASTDVIVPAVVDGSTPTRKVTVTSAARALLDDADAAAMRTTLGVPPAASPTLTGTTTYDRLVSSASTALADTVTTTIDWTATKDNITMTFTADRAMTVTNAPTTKANKEIAMSALSGGPHTITSWTGATITPVGDSIVVPASGALVVTLEVLAGTTYVYARGSIADIYGLQAALDNTVPKNAIAVSSSPVTLAKGNTYVLLSGASTINLPAASNDGGTISICNRSGATRTLTANGSDTIENSRTTISDLKDATLIAFNVGSDEWVIAPRTE